MNYITAAKNTKKLSETELKHNISGKASWHYQYKDSAWIYIGGLPYDLTEGDIICVFSQYGEVVNLNLPRDKKTGKSKGFCFLCYEDQKSTILAVDNLNTIKICGRIIRVDHVEEYKVPKNIDKLDDDALRLLEEGCGPESSVVKTLQGKPSETDERPKRELETIKTEPNFPLSHSRSPPRIEDAKRRNREGRSRDEDAGPRTKRSERQEDSKERSRKYDKNRHDERPRNRDRTRSRSRDRDRKHRSRSRSRETDRKYRR